MINIGFETAAEAATHPAYEKLEWIAAANGGIVDDDRVVMCHACRQYGTETPAFAEVRIDDSPFQLCTDGCIVELNTEEQVPWEFCEACGGTGAADGVECDCWMLAPAVYIAREDCPHCGGVGSVEIAGRQTACPAYCWALDSAPVGTEVNCE